MISETPMSAVTSTADVSPKRRRRPALDGNRSALGSQRAKRGCRIVVGGPQQRPEL